MTLRLLSLAAAALAASLAFAGCSPLAGEPAATRESRIAATAAGHASATAVVAVGGRIVGAEVVPTTEGLGSGLHLEVEVAGAEPLTTDELRAVVVAARDAAPFDPVAVSVVAWARDGAERLALDTWTAGHALFGPSGPYPSGVAITRPDLNRVLGAWIGG